MNECKDIHNIYVSPTRHRFYIILQSSDGEMITYPNNLLMQKGISVIYRITEEKEFFD